MKVLGIDPSVRATGFGIISQEEKTLKVLDYGVIKPSRKQLFHHKINTIRSAIEELIIAHQPDEVVIENPFYAQNIKTALTLGQVRGAALVAVASQNRPLFEYSPLEIKKAVTGYGQADKFQVQTMIKNLLNINDHSISLDATDALAAAYCHLNNRTFQEKIKESQNHKIS
ncbi:MAG: crossover junction endodeoxyribonuclease RuvC [Acidobacteriota bacterium]